MSQTKRSHLQSTPDKTSLSHKTCQDSSWLLTLISRHSSVQNFSCVHRASVQKWHFQTFARSLMFPHRPCKFANLSARYPPPPPSVRHFWSGHINLGFLVFQQLLLIAFCLFYPNIITILLFVPTQLWGVLLFQEYFWLYRIWFWEKKLFV